MERIEIIEDDKTYDSKNDVWVDKFNNIYIKNQFDPNLTVFINISEQRWVYSRSGTGYIDWDELQLAKEIKASFKIAIRKKLKTVSFSYLSCCRLMLAELGSILKPDCVGLSDLKMNEINIIWSNMTPHYASLFRELYRNLANKNIGGASQSIASKLKGMKARNEVRMLRDVLNWHPTRGALTQEEEILLRDSIETTRNESNKEFAIRLYCWLLISTLKRGKQIRELNADCLKVIEQNGVQEYFVLIKAVKNL